MDRIRGDSWPSGDLPEYDQNGHSTVFRYLLHAKLALILLFALLLSFSAPALSGAETILFPTRFTPPSTDAAELERINAIENLGHTILQIYSRAGTGEYNAVLPQVDAVYISERVNTGNVVANLKDVCMGVVNEDVNLTDEFGIVSANNNWGFYSGNQVYIQNPSGHYITQDFSVAGTYTLFDATLGQDLQYLDDAPYPASYQLLGFFPVDLARPNLIAIEIGGLLADGTLAAGRRVFLPWMRSASSAGDFASINSNGLNILRRSLEWAMAENECSFLQKKAYLPDGTRLQNGAQVGIGSEVKFLIYINNTGLAISDLSLQDILDPTFSYVPGTLQIDNSVPACANNSCTPSEESNIFSVVSAAPYRTDAVDSDGVSFDGIDTIDVGDQNVPGNGTVNAAADSVWALLFSVMIN